MAHCGPALTVTASIASTPTALQGTYELEAQALLFEPEADVDAEIIDLERAL